MRDSPHGSPGRVKTDGGVVKTVGKGAAGEPAQIGPRRKSQSWEA